MPPWRRQWYSLVRSRLRIMCFYPSHRGSNNRCRRRGEEPAIVDLSEAVKRAREGDTLIENSKVKDSQSNGRAERAVQEHEGLVRTMKLALERRLGRKVHSTHPVMNWLVECGCHIQ